MKCIILCAVLATGTFAQQVHRFGRWEQTFTTVNEYADPLKDIEIVVTFQGPGTEREEVPAFWDGGKTWKVRFTPDQGGTYSWTVRASVPGEKELNTKSGKFQVTEYKGPNPLYRLGEPRLSADRHYMVQLGGKPWFFLSDTAWNGALLSTNEEWKRYIADRVAKRYTAVQFVMTQWRAGRQDENGQIAFVPGAPMKVNPRFFERMDRKISELNDAGLVAVPVMLWALTSKDKESPGESLSTEDAIALARYMAARYAAHKIIWFLGGDGDYAGPNAAKWKQIGRAVFPEGRKRHLVGIHPRGMRAPWAEYREEEWLDLLLYQTGHGSDARKWRWNATQGMAADWKNTPARPVIDAEPNYEGHLSYQAKKVIGDYEVRRAAYYSLLAGPPAGVSYGAHGIWYWSRKPEVPLDHPRTGVALPWWECLKYPGSKQMAVLRNIFDSVEWWRLRPDRSLLKTDGFDEESFSDYAMPALSREGDTGMVYIPVKREVHLDLTKFSGGKVRGIWYDPRTGKQSPAGTWDKTERKVSTPGDGDWVLVLRSR